MSKRPFFSQTLGQACPVERTIQTISKRPFLSQTLGQACPVERTIPNMSKRTLFSQTLGQACPVERTTQTRSKRPLFSQTLGQACPVERTTPKMINKKLAKNLAQPVQWKNDSKNEQKTPLQPNTWPSLSSGKNYSNNKQRGPKNY